MERADFLLEIGTEELPPRALENLSQALRRNLETALAQSRLPFSATQAFATPRRLAVIVSGLSLHQKPVAVEKRGPAVSVAFDQEGEPTQAARGFARSCHVAVDELQRLTTQKGEWLVHRTTDTGRPACRLLPDLVSAAASSLPIPRRMSWGDGRAVFVRPVHWLVALLGQERVDMALFDIAADRHTYGHRFHNPQPIRLAQASDYEHTLAKRGWVIADIKRRQESIREQVQAEARALGGRVRLDAGVLEEVTALVEYPVSFSGHFEQRFLTLPEEVLICVLEGHQRYFPVYGENGSLLPAFIAVANIKSKSPVTVRQGNERVIRPRLADALFFWEQDQREPLIELTSGLSRVLFQKGLGTMADKAARIQALAEDLAEPTGADSRLSPRVAALAKADLLTKMVGEFPELQGIMGRYYALAGGETPEVALALEEQYLPRFAGDCLPKSPLGRTLALADRMDSLCGIFALGKKPTGEKDPFALRRAALSVLRILIEGQIELDLGVLAERGFRLQPPTQKKELTHELMGFFWERLRTYYSEQSISPGVFNSVASVQSSHPLDFQRRLDAVNHFLALPEAKRLTAAHKRVRNILRQAGVTAGRDVYPALMEEGPERRLYEALRGVENEHTAMMQRGDYGRALVALADISQAVDAFFDRVRVMTEDDERRFNRLSTLNRLDVLCRSVADLSCLPG